MLYLEWGEVGVEWGWNGEGGGSPSGRKVESTCSVRETFMKFGDSLSSIVVLEYGHRIHRMLTVRFIRASLVVLHSSPLV